MKALLGLACLLAGGAIAVAQSTPAAPAQPASPPTKTKMVLPEKAPSATKTPAAKAPAAKAVKKEDEPGKIDGVAIPRAEGFLGVQVVDGKFKVSFYDAKKKPVTPDIGRAVLRWDPKGKIGQDRAVLMAGGGTALASDKYVRPPYNFKLYITLLKEGADEAGPAESYTIDFRQ